jgi:hypothetical protein
VTSTIQSDELVTCVSCEYRYPHSRGVCNICGTPAPAIEPVLPEVSGHANNADHEKLRTLTNEQHQTGATMLKQRIPLFTVAAVMVFALLGFLEDGRNPTVTTSSVEIASTAHEGNSENAAGPDTVAKSTDAQTLQLRPVKTQSEEGNSNTLDPAKLWSLVKQGSTRAEVTLAKLYLEGAVVTQSCEQAHLLLLVASRKGNGAATSLLSSTYADTCQ